MTPIQFLYYYRIYLGWVQDQKVPDTSDTITIAEISQLVYQIPDDKYDNLYALSLTSNPCL